MSISANRANVHFDFDAALRSARQLWQAAGESTASGARRAGAAGHGEVDFQGRCAEEFGHRRGVEHTSADRIVTGMRADAMLLAKAWKDAMDEQNRRSWARHTNALKEKRSNLAKVGDFFTGFDAPSEPEGVPMPVAPHFAPTAVPVRYDQ